MRFHSEISIVYGNAAPVLTELTGRLVLEFEIARFLGEVILSVVLKALPTWCSDFRKCLQIGNS
jgi:hypothetical protein